MDGRRLAAHADRILGIPAHPDYPNALNGLQVEGDRTIRLVGAAVDAGEATIRSAIEAEVDFLIVHHGLFWDGAAPITGVRYRKVSALIRAGIHLYAAHLPLDAHPRIGNSAILARRMGLRELSPFGETRGVTVGWMGEMEPERVPALEARLVAAVDGPVRTIDAGPAEIRRVAVVTGAAGSLIQAAAEAGADALITGEASHPHWLAAKEAGIHLLLGGHYGTETFGVRALADELAVEFGLRSCFLDHPSGF